MSHMVSCAIAVLVVSLPLFVERFSELESCITEALKAHYQISHFVDAYMRKVLEVLSMYHKI